MERGRDLDDVLVYLMAVACFGCLIAAWAWWRA